MQRDHTAGTTSGSNYQFEDEQPQPRKTHHRQDEGAPERIALLAVVGGRQIGQHQYRQGEDEPSVLDHAAKMFRLGECRCG